jgi:hypothetical protein
MNQSSQEIQASIDVLNAQIELTTKQRAQRVFIEANQDEERQSQLAQFQQQLADAKAAEAQPTPDPSPSQTQ